MKKASNFARSSAWIECFRVREVEIHVRPCAGIAPSAGVDACRPHERTEMELA